MFHETHNLAGYLERALPEAAMVRVERHLEKCRTCRTALAEMRAAGRALGAIHRAAEPAHYDPELWARVRAQIAVRPQGAPIARPRWAFAGGGLALAGAAVCLALVMYQVDHQAQPKPERPLLARVPQDKAAKGRPAGTVPAPLMPGRTGPVMPPSAAPHVAAPPAPKPRGSLWGGGPAVNEAVRAPSAIAQEEQRVAAVPTFGNRYKADTSSKLAAPAGDAAGFRDRRAANAGAFPETLAPADSITALRNSATVNGPANRDTDGPNAAPAPSPGPSDRSIFATPPVVGAPLAASTNGTSWAAAPGAARGALKDETQPDIVMDGPPAMPSVGLEGRFGERHLGSGAQGGIVGTPKASGVASLAARPITLGVSTVEGHALLVKASDAFANGRDDDAARLYRYARAAGLDSSEAKLASVRLGDLAMKSHDAPAAVKHYRAALVSGRDPVVLTKLGDALELSGDATGASAAYRQALAMMPTSPEARAGLERLKGK